MPSPASAAAAATTVSRVHGAPSRRRSALAGEGTPIDDHRASARYRSAMLEQALLKFWAQHAPAPDLEVSR